MFWSIDSLDLFGRQSGRGLEMDQMVSDRAQGMRECSFEAGNVAVVDIEY
jgi:hypothetical protein